MSEIILKSFPIEFLEESGVVDGAHLLNVDTPEGYYIKSVVPADIRGDISVWVVFHKSERSPRKIQDDYSNDKFLAVVKCIQKGVKSDKNELVKKALNGEDMNEGDRRELVTKHKRWCQSDPKCI